MRTFNCICGETMFFDNTRCVSCGRDAGFCPACQQLVSLIPDGKDAYHCGNPGCCASLTKCDNYQHERVCNRCVVMPSAESRCDCCRFNVIIPSLSIGDNRAKWRRLEAAKRRLFYHLDLLGLPRGNQADGFVPPLSFEFKEDLAPAWNTGEFDSPEPIYQDDRVMTGHFNGKITINLREADPAERERLRIQFGEHHRSLIGHFRHEIGHYYWDLLIKGQREQACKAVFGDHENPTYAEALRVYYQRGPHTNWNLHYASAYASMHPWEDFSETFSAYLEMIATLDTAIFLGLDRMHDLDSVPSEDFDAMSAVYVRIGIAINELNRTMGLKDLLTRPMTKTVVEKMRFIHTLIGKVRGPIKPHMSGIKV